MLSAQFALLSSQFKLEEHLCTFVLFVSVIYVHVENFTA